MGYEDALAKVAPEDRADFQRAYQLQQLLWDVAGIQVAKPDLVAKAAAVVEADFVAKGESTFAAVTANLLQPAKPVAAQGGVE